MRRQKEEWPFGLGIAPSSTKTCTEGVCVHHFSNAYPEMKAKSSSMKFTPGCVCLTLAQEL
jgi:hypothetical protein